MIEIRLLAVPYEVGALRMGVGRGPERLIEAGAQEALGSEGAEVSVETIELQEDLRDRSGASEAKAAFELIGLVSNAVQRAVEDGAFPVLLSGSCFAGIGVVTGLAERSPGVVWFDAHGDFNTPESTIDGYFDGMPLALLTGGAWRTMISGREIRTVPESAVVLAGARDFDPLEQLRLDSSSVHRLPPAAIDSDGAVARAVDAMDPPPTGLYLHLDLDVLDSEEARVNIYSVPDGLSADQLNSQVRSLLDARPVRAVSLTAYDPECDPEGRVPADRHAPARDRRRARRARSMRALVQRVSQAAVDVEGERVAQIGPGMLVLLGVSRDDTEAEADRLAEKVRALRIFDDADGQDERAARRPRDPLRQPVHALRRHAEGHPAQLRAGRAGRSGGAAL